MLSSIGAVVGMLLAWWITRVVASLSLPTPIPFAFDLRIDGRVLLFTLVATFAAALLAGLVPALQGVEAEPGRRPARRSRRDAPWAAGAGRCATCSSPDRWR